MDETMVDAGGGATATPSGGMKLRERKRKPVLEDEEAVENVQPKRPRARAPGRPKGSPNKKKTNPAGSAESELLASLRGGQNIGRLVDEWIREYEENVDNGIVKILQFFISATGCKGALTAVQIKSVEFKNIIANLSDDGRNSARLFGDFIMVFVSKIKSGIIFDESFTDYVLQLLTGLADSQIRAFRHTATFAAMKLSSAMVDVVVELVELKDKNVRQIETEKTKLKQRATNERLDALLASKSDLENKIQELCLMIQFVFKSVFAHRYRDTVPDIRCICITELSNWMSVYPALFLEDSYLKYIGWSLYDKCAEVRMKCVTGLLPLYERADVIARLELFTSKFKERLVHMVTDKELDVAVKSCQLLTQIHRAFPTLLQLKDCVSIYETVYCSNRPLAVAAGEFLNVRVFQGVDESGQPLDSRSLIQNLVAFFIEGEVHNHSAYLVDAPHRHQSDHQGLDRHGRDAALGRGCRGAAAAKDAKVLHDERVAITESFIPTLPRLLNKFIADQEKITALTQIPLYFELEIYQVGRHERQLGDLMDALDRVFDQHSDEETLQGVVKVLRQFSLSNTMAKLTDNARIKLIDRIALQFRQSTEEALNELPRRLDEEDVAKVAAAFSKLNTLLMVFEIRNVDIWDLVTRGISLLFYAISHDIVKAAREKESKATFNRIRKRRDDFLTRVRNIMEYAVFNVEQAFLYLCDMLVMCNWKHPEAGERAGDLVANLDARFISVINTFVVNNVFETSQEEFEKLDQQQQYSKLIIYGQLPIVDMSLVLRYYASTYNDYGDIFKHLLTRCREMDRMSMAQAIIRALKNVYEEIRVAEGGEIVDPESAKFAELRELAKKFAAFFGTELSKNREAVALIHHTGIQSAFNLDAQSRPSGRRRQAASDQPQAISFLEILAEFSPKLLRHDKTAIHKYLMEHCKPPEDHADDPEWGPFLIYKKSLSNSPKMPRFWSGLMKQPFGVKLTGLWGKHPRFTNRTVMVANNDVDAAFLTLNRLMEREGMLKIIRNTQYFIKPTKQRQLMSLEASRAIVREDLQHKMKFLMRKNRVDAYPGQLTQ
ncbi:SCD domain-containing protein [Aphelenchoides fujianensis]|nr:SCD domain-containing protein [Aphelenchoides fujianensis]